MFWWSNGERNNSLTNISQSQSSSFLKSENWVCQNLNKCYESESVDPRFFGWILIYIQIRPTTNPDADLTVLMKSIFIKCLNSNFSYRALADMMIMVRIRMSMVTTAATADNQQWQPMTDNSLQWPTTADDWQTT